MKDILIRLLSNLRKSAKSADRLLLSMLSAFSAVCSAIADEPFFKKNDVIALVGGEDMVAMSEYGYLELLLQRALPDYHLKFRDLAWEGDTVFEQRRDLNFPPLEAQLDQVGATVVICQFGQMESLGKGGTRNGERGSEEARKAEVAEFTAAYEKLIERMRGGGKRRIVVISPTPLSDEAETRNAVTDGFVAAIQALATKTECLFVNIARLGESYLLFSLRDGVHLNETMHLRTAYVVADPLTKPGLIQEVTFDLPDALPNGMEFLRARRSQALAVLLPIRGKNRLWFNYWRVENWAFLAGDRTEQPSSRDHLDRNKRWFPAERERFLPLIEAKEQEIWALAAKLATP